MNGAPCVRLLRHIDSDARMRPYPWNRAAGDRTALSLKSTLCWSKPMRSRHSSSIRTLHLHANLYCPRSLPRAVKSRRTLWDHSRFGARQGFEKN